MTQEQSKYTLRMTPKGLLGWVVLALLLLGWMFVLGILVGRGTVAMPRKRQALENELADLKENTLQKERAEIEAQAKGGQEKTSELGFFKALREPPPKPPAQTRPSPTPVKPKAAPPAQAASAPSAASNPEAIPKPTVTPKPADKPKVSVPPQPEIQPAPTPAAGKAHFTVQVAAYKDLESADKLVGALRAKGYPAYQLRSEASGKDAWFRVRVGAFESRPGADVTLKKLQGEKYKAVVLETP